MNRKKITRPTDFRAWTPDFDEWPERWMGMEEDLDYGRRLLPYFAEFLQALLEEGLSRRTFALHRDNLWLLGGSIVSRVNMFEEYGTRWTNSPGAWRAAASPDLSPDERQDSTMPAPPPREVPSKTTSVGSPRDPHDPARAGVLMPQLTCICGGRAELRGR